MPWRSLALGTHAGERPAGGRRSRRFSRLRKRDMEITGPTSALLPPESRRREPRPLGERGELCPTDLAGPNACHATVGSRDDVFASDAAGVKLDPPRDELRVLDVV